MDGIELEMPEHTINPEPETILINASNYCNMVEENIRGNELESAKDKFSKIIQDYKTYLPKIGRIPNIKHEINTCKNKIIAKKPFPVPFSIRDAVKAELKEMLDLDVIEESDFLYISPAFALRKKNG